MGDGESLELVTDGEGRGVVSAQQPRSAYRKQPRPVGQKQRGLAEILYNGRMAASNIPDLLTQVITQFQEFHRSLTTASTKTEWFRHVLSRLSELTLREYKVLENSDRESINYAAWSARNLLELDIFTSYVLVSEVNAKRFYDDRLVDADQLFTAFKDFQVHLNPQSDVSALDKILKLIAETKKKEGVTYTKFLQASELAKQVGKDVEFSKMNKICSKLVHPTAWSIFVGPDTEHWRSILLMAGQQYMANIYSSMKGHVDQLGVEPKP